MGGGDGENCGEYEGCDWKVYLLGMKTRCGKQWDTIGLTPKLVKEIDKDDGSDDGVPGGYVE